MAGNANRAHQSIPIMWMVRSKNGKLFQTFLEKGIVAMGGMESDPIIGDIGRHDTFGSLREQVRERRPDKLPGWVGRVAGNLWRLSREIQAGNRVITYNPTGRNYAIGVVTGAYRYEEVWASGPERYSHARDVQWDETMVVRDVLPLEIQKDLSKRVTVYKLSLAAIAAIMEVAGKADVA